MKRNRDIIFVITALVIIISSAFYLNYNSIKPTFNEKPKKMPIHKVETEKKELSLTFDINWAEEDYIYDILTVLDKYNVKGTFFIMGKWVNYTEDNLKKLQAIKDKGHEIGNHSYVHPNFSSISKERMIEEVKKTEDILKESIGVKTDLFRFPSGAFNEESLKVLEDLGYKNIQWNIDSVDWRNDGERVEYERVIKKIENGSILLFHNNAKYTPKNLDKIISELLEKGYEFKKVSEILIDKNYKIDNVGIQHKN